MKFELPKEQNKIEILGHSFEYDNDGMVKLGPIASFIGGQSQYISEYITGISKSPKLAEDLRISGGDMGYHSLKIHKDDVETFIRRVREHRKQNGL